MTRLSIKSCVWMRTAMTAAVAGAAVLFLAWHSTSPVSCASSVREEPVQKEKALGAFPLTSHRGIYSPAPLPLERRLAAMRIFEKVHPTLTIHYSGFSRNGSLVCYDMLNELRTVEEAKSLMDVEFHLLDLMLEHYKVDKHMRVVDANVVKNILDLGSLFSFRFPDAVMRVTRFIKDYDPILRVFLKRYLPHIEYLVIVNVPSFFVPLLPSIASRIMGIPPNKLVALSSGEGLEKFMDRKYVPKEFGNPQGNSVRASTEDLTASCLMLQEIKLHLGEAALSEEGKRMLQQHGPKLLGKRKEAFSSSTGLVAAEEEPFDDID
ncbi:hypothetical protein Emag_004983 [Eimeria magna]